MAPPYQASPPTQHKMDQTSEYCDTTPTSAFTAQRTEPSVDELKELLAGVARQPAPQPIVHYVPPSAISTRYYTLSDPNMYTYTVPPSGPVPTGDHPGTPLPTVVATTNTFYAPQTAVTANFAFAPTPTTSRTPASTNPILPKQSRNRDDPGGESGPLAQPTAYLEVGPALLRLGENPRLTISGTSRATRAIHTGFRLQRGCVEPPPAIVPSQWQLGAALDELRSKDRARFETGSAAAMESRYGLATRSPVYPLSAEDSARLAHLKARLGINVDIDVARAGSSTSPAVVPSPTASTPGASTDSEYSINKAAIYSPTTGRKLALSGEHGKPPVQIMPGTTSAKKPYKRGTAVACVFCRKRKIACGGPQEGDAARRCG
ncbi:hypothetical protein C2E23DRAFT_864860 [Lenzites betulinus]|nr:hypothetical protein C2E23DRAFT_864860 [Lenzites betulinus]